MSVQAQDDGQAVELDLGRTADEMGVVDIADDMVRGGGGGGGGESFVEARVVGNADVVPDVDPEGQLVGAEGSGNVGHSTHSHLRIAGRDGHRPGPVDGFPYQQVVDSVVDFRIGCPGTLS